MLERIPGSGRYVEQEVNRCFGTDVAKDLVRRGSADHRATIALHLPDEGGREQARYRVDFGSKGVEVAGQFNTLPEVTGFSAEDSELPSFYYEDPSFLLSSAVNAMFESLTRPLMRRAYYLPSDRTGVMHSHQVVVSALIQRATAAGLRPSESVPLLSGVLADFLNGLIWMNQPQRTPSRKLADALEQNLLAGAVRLNRSETGYPSFAYRPAKWDSDVSLMRTSSMVSELAPVVLYLRYLVETRRSVDHRRAGVASASCLADRIRSGTGAAGAFGSPRSVDHAQRMDPGGARQPRSVVGVVGGAARRDSRRGRGADSGPGGCVAVQADQND